MYDFYAKPPSNHAEIVEYLKSWIQPVEDGRLVNNWKMTHGFKRAFCAHQVYKNLETNQYTFYVHNSEDWDGIDTSMFGVYDSYDAMIDGVATKYVKFWNLA